MWEIQETHPQTARQDLPGRGRQGQAGGGAGQPQGETQAVLGRLQSAGGDGETEGGEDGEDRGGQTIPGRDDPGLWAALVFYINQKYRTIFPYLEYIDIQL